MSERNVRTSDRNVFLFWIGKEYKLIKTLRDLIYSYSTIGKGYKVHFINHENIHTYIKELPDCFFKLQPMHQADYVRYCVIYEYGGIWLDADTLVLGSLDSLFDILDKKDGFFIMEDPITVCNGVFGSKPHTDILKYLKEESYKLIQLKGVNLKWAEIGPSILTNLKQISPHYFRSCDFFYGRDDMYPINWNMAKEEYLDKPYDNYKTIVRNYQPLIILVNTVYKSYEELSDEKIKEGTLPLDYFLNTSLKNVEKSMPKQLKVSAPT